MQYITRQLPSSGRLYMNEDATDQEWVCSEDVDEEAKVVFGYMHVRQQKSMMCQARKTCL